MLEVLETEAEKSNEGNEKLPLAATVFVHYRICNPNTSALSGEENTTKKVQQLKLFDEIVQVGAILSIKVGTSEKGWVCIEICHILK